MRTYTAPDDLKLAGYMTMAFLDNLQSEETRPIFAKHHLTDLDPNSWYPATEFMQAMNELVEQGNMSSNFVAIGLEVGRLTPYPPEMTLIDVLTHGWNEGYYAVHGNYKGDIGQVKCEKVTDKHYKTIHNHLYPDDFSYGIIYGFARRFLPVGTSFKVYYDTDLPQRDRDNADTTVIHIEWK